MDHTVLPANYTVPAFTRWRIPRLRLRTSNCSLLLVYLPRKDERLSRPGWLTYSGQFTHISGHPSGASWAQDSESSHVRDRRSATVPRIRYVIQCHDSISIVISIIIIIIIIIFIRSWQTATNYKNKLIDQSINAFVQHSENEIFLS